MSGDTVSAEEARGLLEAATPGPWEARFHEDMGMIAWQHGWIMDGDRPPEHERADTQLAAASPDLARTVIALHEELAAERKASAAALEGMGAAVAERDAYKRAKMENDERFMNERDEARNERDRLARILAVERGDEGQAPEGWRVGASGWFAYGEDPGQCDREIMREDLTEPWLWVIYSDDGPATQQGPAPSALEAMEAADEARKESTT